MTTNCNGCGQELESPEAFDPEYTYCRSMCCRCCPDSKTPVCQQNKLDRKNGRPVGLVESLAQYND